jgi:TetR/AcrR family transcriptional regulator
VTKPAVIPHPQDNEVAERIMANALPLFADHGYSGVSMRAIAAAAGLTIGTLYHYFSNKEALYLGVLQASYASCAEQWQTIFDAPTPPLERLRDYLFQYCKFAAENKEFVGLVKREQLEGNPQRMELMANVLLGEQFEKTWQLLEEINPDIDARMAANSLIGMVVHHFEIAALRQRFPQHRDEYDDPARVSEHIYQILVHGLLGKPAE